MPEDSRPNPDALLRSLQREEAAKKRGKLKVFLGMSPGVGKTFAMLEAARRELAAGWHGQPAPKAFGVSGKSRVVLSPRPAWLRRSA